MKVLVTRPIPRRGLDRLRAAGLDIDQWSGAEPMPRAELLAHVASAHAILTAVANKIDREILSAAPALKIVANMGVGFDNVDRAAAAERGVIVTNTPEVLTETTADMAFGLILATARRIAEGNREIRAGHWDLQLATRLLGEEVHHATLGIVGFGRIGRAVARRAHGFSMRVIYADPLHTPEMLSAEEHTGATRIELGALLASADFVSLHPDLNSTSKKLIGSAALSAMKPTAVLINASRGPVVDTGALTAALRDKTIAAAGLDVTDPEPLPAGHELTMLPNALITPHMSTQSRETREAMSDLAARNIVEVLAGRPPLTAV